MERWRVVLNRRDQAAVHQGHRNREKELREEGKTHQNIMEKIKAKNAKYEAEQKSLLSEEPVVPEPEPPSD